MTCAYTATVATARSAPRRTGRSMLRRLVAPEERVHEAAEPGARWHVRQPVRLECAVQRDGRRPRRADLGEVRARADEALRAPLADVVRATRERDGSRTRRALLCRDRERGAPARVADDAVLRLLHVAVALRELVPLLRRAPERLVVGQPAAICVSRRGELARDRLWQPDARDVELDTRRAAPELPEPGERLHKARSKPVLLDDDPPSGELGGKLALGRRRRGGRKREEDRGDGEQHPHGQFGRSARSRAKW